MYLFSVNFHFNANYLILAILKEKNYIWAYYNDSTRTKGGNKNQYVRQCRKHYGKTFLYIT